MMSKVIDNAAVNAKIHAKLKNRMTDQDYERLVNCTSVMQIAAILKKNNGYKKALQNLSETEIHRAELERRLKSVISEDLRTLMPYVNASSKAFLSLFEIRDEIWNLKLLLRMIIQPGEMKHIEFIKTSGVDFEELRKVSDVDSLIAALKGTPYERVMASFTGHKDKQTLFAMETALDSFYQTLTFSYIKRYLTKQEQSIAEKTYGTEIDLQTMMFIIRAKIYYGFSPQQIYPYVDTKLFRLKHEEVQKLAEAPDKESALAVAKSTCYGELFDGGLNGIEARISAYSLKKHSRGFVRQPYSLESVLYFIKAREVEIRNIVMITEGVRYGLLPKEIKSYIIKTQ